MRASRLTSSNVIWLIELACRGRRQKLFHAWKEFSYIHSHRDWHMVNSTFLAIRMAVVKPSNVVRLLFHNARHEHMHHTLRSTAIASFNTSQWWRRYHITSFCVSDMRYIRRIRGREEQKLIDHTMFSFNCRHCIKPEINGSIKVQSTPHTFISAIRTAQQDLHMRTEDSTWQQLVPVASFSRLPK